MSDSLARKLLTSAGVFTGKTTRREDLWSLVSGLRIVPTDKALIRVGPDKDGGYLLPDDFEDISHCFSPGVSDCSDFELSLAERGMDVYLADRSVDGPAVQHPKFRFTRKFLASMDAAEEGLMTLDAWYHETLGPVSEHSPEAVLQMDIEGSEYEVIHNMSEPLLKRFRIIVVEFHRLHQLIDRYSFGWMSRAFRKLLRNHAVVHLHPNNALRTIAYGGVEVPFTMEFTFLRRDRFRAIDQVLTFPHPLDRRNVESMPDLILPACWFSGNNCE